MYEIENFGAAIELKSLLVKSAHASFTVYIDAEFEEAVLDVLMQLYKGSAVVINVADATSDDITAQQLAGLLVEYGDEQQLRVFCTRKDCVQTAIDLTIANKSITAYVIVSGAIKCKVVAGSVSDFVHAYCFDIPLDAPEDYEKRYMVYHPIQGRYM